MHVYYSRNGGAILAVLETRDDEYEHNLRAQGIRFARFEESTAGVPMDGSVMVDATGARPQLVARIAGAAAGAASPGAQLFTRAQLDSAIDEAIRRTLATVQPAPAPTPPPPPAPTPTPPFP